jgi:tetraprenyl-beta-curcumene synthase
MAEVIPDRALRADALCALKQKRANIDGAALFWTLPTVRSRDLLALLVSYEILADYLDCTSERAADVGIENGLQLHRALVEALDPSLAVSDYYRYHPWQDDGGYAQALVTRCRQVTARLPSYEQIRPLATRAARLAQVLALNHELDPALRDRVLREWAQRHAPGDGLAWYESTAAASAWLTILALLALAADPARSKREAQATYDAYLPWVSLAGTMLDSYSDLDEDRMAGAHSYLDHYPSVDIAVDRLAALTTRALEETTALPDGERHVVLVSCMIAMYLSKQSTREPDWRSTTIALARHAGPLPRALTPVLRFWRILYGQQSDAGRSPFFWHRRD